MIKKGLIMYYLAVTGRDMGVYYIHDLTNAQAIKQANTLLKSGIAIDVCICTYF
jgi:hypothetical protein